MTLLAAVELAPEHYREPLLETLEKFQIPNSTEFLATVYYESEYLTSMVENLNYSTDALLKKFSRKRISYEDAMRYGRNNRHPAFQENLANVLYGGKFGREELGNFQTGDGWHYRGQCPIQLTGRANWEGFGRFINRPDVAENPSIAVKDPLLACYSAGWFWTHLKKLHLCGTDMRAITKKVTGAADTAIKTRLTVRDRVKTLMEAP